MGSWGLGLAWEGFHGRRHVFPKEGTAWGKARCLGRACSVPGAGSSPEGCFEDEEADEGSATTYLAVYLTHPSLSDVCLGTQVFGGFPRASPHQSSQPCCGEDSSSPVYQEGNSPRSDGDCPQRDLRKSGREAGRHEQTWPGQSKGKLQASIRVPLGGLLAWDLDKPASPCLSGCGFKARTRGL